MKIVFYNYEPKGLKEDYLFVDNVHNLLKIKDIGCIFLFEKNINNLYNTLSEILKILPQIKFIPIIEKKNISIIPKLMAIGAYSFVLPPFDANIKKTLNI